MKKRLFQLSLFIVLTGVLLSGVAVAVDYTTKRGKTTPKAEVTAQKQMPSTASSEKKTPRGQLPCSKEDMRAIRKFDRIAHRKAREHEELSEKSEKIKTVEDSMEFGREMNEILAFTRSAEYKAMVPIYKRCNREIPVFRPERQFWIPNNYKN